MLFHSYISAYVQNIHPKVKVKWNLYLFALYLHFAKYSVYNCGDYTEQVLYEPPFKYIFIQTTNALKFLFKLLLQFTLKVIHLLYSMRFWLGLVLSWQDVPYLFFSRSLTSQICNSFFRDNLNIYNYNLHVLSLNQFNIFPHSRSYFHLCCKNCNIPCILFIQFGNNSAYVKLFIPLTKNRWECCFQNCSFMR